MSRKKRAETIHLEQDTERPVLNYPKKTIKAKTDGQQLYIDAILSNIITFCEGPAGSGKTTVPVGIAIDMLRRRDILKLVLTRPIIGAAGEDIGSLPGTADDKVHPYMRPLLDEIRNYANKQEVEIWFKNKEIEILPLSFMRGTNLHQTFVCCDEFQNATFDQIKLVLTRLGRDSKIVISGDVTQSDLPLSKQGALDEYMDMFVDFESIGLVQLTHADIVRHPFIGKILKRIEDAKRTSKEPPRYY